MTFALDFLAPDRLLLLLAVAALVVVYVVTQLRRRSTYAVRFTNLALLDVVAPRRPGWRRHVAAGVLIGAMVTLVVAFAQPAREEDVPVERATVVLAIDVSLSMEATDVAPTRLVAAQEAATEFLDTVPDTINVGLVSFSGSATVAVPPTTDHEDVRRGIEALRLGEGTGIGEAIFASLDALATLPDPVEDEEPVPATIIVLTDGETTMGRPNEAGVDAAIDAEVPVSTIAFGTEDGSITIEGQTVPVPPDLDTMEAIADDTGGLFFGAEDAGELESAYTDLGSSVGSETELVDVSEWFVGGGLVLLLAAAGLSLVWFARLP